MAEEFRTRSGKLLTDADFERLADEAEKGYDVDEILARREACAECGKTGLRGAAHRVRGADLQARHQAEGQASGGAAMSPSLTLDEQHRMLGGEDTCRECGEVVVKNYYRACDEFFYVGHASDCSRMKQGPYSEDHRGHRTY